jgi:hypothetical protein
MFRYPWPASQINRDLMARLHQARERERPRRPITVLVAEAIKAKYLEYPRSNNNEPLEAA